MVEISNQTKPLAKETLSPEGGPKGLEYYKHFLSQAEQAQLLQRIDAEPWEEAGNSPRRVQQYGFKYEHASRELSTEGQRSIPSWLEPLLDKISACQIMNPRPNQVIINEYLPGQGIRLHLDNIHHFGATIVSISLGSCAVMRFTSLAEPPQVKDVMLEPGSLVVLNDESRYRWRHEIPSRLVDKVGDHEFTRGRRVSITLRTVSLDASSDKEPETA